MVVFTHEATRDDAVKKSCTIVITMAPSKCPVLTEIKQTGEATIKVELEPGDEGRRACPALVDSFLAPMIHLRASDGHGTLVHDFLDFISSDTLRYEIRCIFDNV